MPQLANNCTVGDLTDVLHDEVRLALESASGRAARAFVQDALHDWGWNDEQPGHDLEDILLLTSELTINGARHGRSAMDLTVRYWPGSCVRVEVHDDGDGTPQCRQPGDFEESGRGLALVDLLSERWGVTACAPGKTVWFEHKLG